MMAIEVRPEIFWVRGLGTLLGHRTSFYLIWVVRSQVYQNPLKGSLNICDPLYQLNSKDVYNKIIYMGRYNLMITVVFI